jgi:ATP-binding protein involved in chromosome partitioning
MFEKLDVPIVGVVENMSGEFFGTGAGEQLAHGHGLDYLGTIPLDMNVRIGGDSGEPVVVAHPESAAAEAFQTVSKRVAARISVLTLSNDTDFIPIQLVG